LLPFALAALIDALTFHGRGVCLIHFAATTCAAGDTYRSKEAGCRMRIETVRRIVSRWAAVISRFVASMTHGKKSDSSVMLMVTRVFGKKTIDPDDE
jgi:hypothetical protein